MLSRYTHAKFFDAGLILEVLEELFALNIQAEIEKANIVTEQEEDRNVLKMLMLVIGTLVVFFALSIIVARYVTGMDSAEMSVDTMVESATIDRIKPFGEMNTGVAPVAVASGSADGKGTYSSSCAACHATGAAGSPKFGDKAAWKARIAQGDGTLFDRAINGFTGKKGVMPARGGNASLSDDAVKADVKYMVDASK